LKARILDGLCGVRQRFPLELNLVRQAAIAVSMTVAGMAGFYAPT
jgi:hypothetical protein